jgi:hypothetical protein
MKADNPPTGFMRRPGGMLYRPPTPTERKLKVLKEENETLNKALQEMNARLAALEANQGEE